MADKSIFSIDVETSTFDKFKQSFHEYSEKLRPPEACGTLARFA